MPSESVAGFLDHAKASRVLFPEQVEQLIRQPDMPQGDLATFCEFLLARGVLTRFQAAAIREGRGHDLSYANYPVIDEIGPCPGGFEYKALHPSLRVPLVLRRLRADWLAPADNPANYVGRARAFGMLPHPNLVHLLDAGFVGNEVYLLIDPPPDGADLESLAKEIGGAMPGFLAAEYGRAVASVLRAVHERGGVHGDVRPANLLVGPLTTKTGSDGKSRRRPAPDAVLRLAGMGLVPSRPPASVFPPDPAAAPYLPPERVDAGNYDPRGDLYGLGATLYFLLTGRPPFVADTTDDILTRVRAVDPTPIAAVRPDLPAELTGLVARMMEKRPERRPATAYEVEAGLIKFCRPGTVPPQPVLAPPAPAPVPQPEAVYPVAAPVSSVGLGPPVAVVAEEPPPEPADAWGVSSDTLASAHADAAAAAPRRRESSAKDKAKTRMLIVLGGMLHLTAVAMVVAYFMGVFDGGWSDPEPSTNPTQKSPDKPGQKKTKSRT